MHTRKSDEELLIQFVKDQGWDEPDLVLAVLRLEVAIREGLQEYESLDESPDLIG